MVGIYQIYNTKNKMSYIGQSKNVEERLKSHKRNIILGKHNIPKEEIEDLQFIILEECSVSDLNEKEKEWITIFDSYKNGYNKTEGGGGSLESWSQDKERAIRIQKLLTKKSLSMEEVSEIENVHISTVSRINSGEIHYSEDIEYPIRKPQNRKVNYQCIDCGIEIYQGSTRCPKCDALRRRTVKRPNREELLDLLFEHQNFTKIGQMFGVSDNSIRKWCDSYKIPRHIRHYKPNIQKRKVTNGKVIQMDIITNEILNTFDSAIAAARHLGNEDYNKHISSACTGKRPSAYGYKWKRIPRT